ncbi:FtsQ-type POTRA domain-containing protein [Agromyces sp. Marseille-Q5079]|uniref:FtsQ-type POTRA domain-containing protein n=1 Tax=Agromyces sp. Marseille-Q5079 TaxID=3439059 RepID=UPI003D9CAB6B
MKRPQGFDGPAPPRAASKPSSGDGSRSTARPAPSRAGAPAQRATPLSGARGPLASGTAVGQGKGADPTPTPRIAVEDTGLATSAKRSGADAPELVASASTPATTARGRWGSRRAVAAAARERRRYERAEVRRFTVRSRRRRLAWTVALGTLAALVAVVVISAYSPLMALREVRVEGASRVPADAVVEAFDPMLGTPLTMLDRDEVQAALASFPLIETYQVEAVPPGTLVVRLVERTPVGVIETSDGLALVDAAGVVIERPDARPDGQPLITVEGGVTGDGFRAVAAVVRSLPAEVRGMLTGASAETVDDVQLELGDTRVVWGSAEESSLKAAVLAGLMRAAPPGTVSEYDVSAPMSPVTR